MKVLQIYKDYYPPTQGGIERHVNTLSRGLRQRGATVTVLVSNTAPVYTEQYIDGIRVVKAPQLCRMFSAPVNLSLPLLLGRLGRRADVLHFHMPNPTADMAYLCSCVLRGLSGSRIVATYHSDIVRQRFLGRLYSPFFKKFLDMADAVVVTSPGYEKRSRQLRAHRHKCLAVPLGIDMERFENGSGPEQTARIRSRYGPEIVLFVGKFRYYKGLDVLVRAMRHARGNLVLIGSGPFEQKLKTMVADLGLANRVFFPGELEDREVDVFLNACDVFVLPSTQRSEAFGLAQLEAMACARPVISTELATGTSYVNQHNVTGFVVPPSDARSLARAINRVLSDPHLREQMGRAAKCRAGQYFSRECMIDGIMDIYQRVLNGCPAK